MTESEITEKFPLRGRNALVTGGSRGIGLAIATAFAKSGAEVAIIARSTQALENATKTIEEAGGKKVIGVSCDVTNESEVQEAIAFIEQKLGNISVLVNSAGQSSAIGPIWETDPQLWWRDVEVNLKGTFLVTREIVGRMIQHSLPGCIINLSSAAGNFPVPMSSAYACSKAAIQRFTDSLAPTIKSHGITVFAYSPGTVRTDMTQHFVNSSEVHRWMPEWRDISPERWTPIEKVGEVAVLLASGQADALSGRFIHIHSDINRLVGDAEKIKEKDFYVLRLREPHISR
jgi:NAD(P)-dependent dehydrogenase (short-subunit alcohol dehydrogenase family)